VELQSKFLRVLEDGVVRRVGGSREITVRVRVIAATNAPVEQLLERGKFREDLYYRLNVFPLALPPLRKRREDLLLLAEHFLAEFSRANDRTLAGFSEDALALLAKYNWPGNVRELRNAIQRAVILCREGEIQAHHLPPRVRAGTSAAAPEHAAAPGSVSLPVGTSIDDAERVLILETLASCGGNKTQAAAQLGISVKTLYVKLNKYGEAAEEPPG
jgi:DNA-binding NtrC family response regulator